MVMAVEREDWRVGKKEEAEGRSDKKEKGRKEGEREGSTTNLRVSPSFKDSNTGCGFTFLLLSSSEKEQDFQWMEGNITE